MNELINIEEKYNILREIDGNTFFISDTHFGHNKVLFFEPVRIEYLIDTYPELHPIGDKLLNLLQSVPADEQRTNKQMLELSDQLLPYHNEMLYNKWNSVVGENDIVFHLGDFAFKGVSDHLKKLNGRKILMRGNHDRQGEEHYINCGFDLVIDNIMVQIGSLFFEKEAPTKFQNGLIIDIGDHRILLSHYPIFDNCPFDSKFANTIGVLEELYDDCGCDFQLHGHSHSKMSKFPKGFNLSIEHCNFLMPMKLNEIYKKYQIDTVLEKN